jgi:hypothetical protein
VRAWEEGWLAAVKGDVRGGVAMSMFQLPFLRVWRVCGSLGVMTSLLFSLLYSINVLV